MLVNKKSQMSVDILTCMQASNADECMLSSLLQITCPFRGMEHSIQWTEGNFGHDNKSGIFYKDKERWKREKQVWLEESISKGDQGYKEKEW